MSYSNDNSYYYSSSDDSFSYISDYSTSYHCPIHYSTLPPPPPPPPPPPIPTTYCPIHQSYPYYYQIPPQPILQPIQVSSPISLPSSSTFQNNRPTKKTNRRFTEDQIRILEEHFYKVDKYVTKETIDDLSTRTQLKPAQIRVWFNNKRTREHQ